MSNAQTNNATDNQTAVAAKPNKADFRMTVVLASNGSIVPQDQWEKEIKIDPSNKRDFKKEAGKLGWTVTSYFNREGFQEAYDAFRVGAKQSKTQQVEETIAEAFEAAGVETQHPRLVNALRTLMPMFGGEENHKRTLNALERIIKAADSAMVEEAPKQKRQPRNADSGNGKTVH